MGLPPTPATIPGVQPVAPGVTAGIPALMPPIPPGSSPNPGIAFILGFVPGLGAIYNGEYKKAMIHILVMGGIIVGVSGGLGDSLQPFWILALVSFVFYMAIDALRTARARQTGQIVTDPFENWTKNRSMGPFILIGIGGLFLLHNFGFFDMYRVREFIVPVVLIGIGVLMLRNKVGRQD